MTISQATELVTLFDSIRKTDRHKHILTCCILLEGSNRPKEEFPYLETLTSATKEDFKKAIGVARAAQAREPALSPVYDAVIAYIQSEWLLQKIGG